MEREGVLSQEPFSPWVERRKFSARCQSQWYQCVGQQFCDEGGVEFGAPVAENPMPLWSHYSFLWSDETWLSEWSDGLGERSGAHSPVAWGVLGQASLPAI